MRRPLVSVLDRYLIRELMPPFALGIVLFTFFLFIDQIYHLTDLVITKGVPVHLVVQLLVFMLPNFLAHTLPMALLVAVLLAGGRLAGDLEVVACKAAGVGLMRLFRPILAVALVVTGVGAILTLWMTPRANREFQHQLFRILESRAVSGLHERVFNTTFGDIVIYFEEISSSQVALRNVIVSDERNATLSRIISAQEGRLLSDEANRRITLRLLDGAVNEADVVRVQAPAGDAAPSSGAAGAKRYRYTRFAVYDLSLNVNTSLRAAPVDKPERDLPLGALRSEIRARQGHPVDQAPYVVELQKRLAYPVAALVFAFMGFPLAVRSHRGGRSIALVATLVIVVTYHLVATSLESMTLRQRLPVWMAIWTPNTLFGMVGTGLLFVTAREWRPRHLGLFWRVLNALWQSLPARPRRRGERGPTRDSTHLMDRYLLRQFLLFAGIGLSVATALLIIIDLLQTLDKFLRIKPPLVFIAEHFAYRLPAELYEGLPIVMLVATIFLFLTLTRYHELTALKAAGVSLYRTSAPILVLGVLVVIGAGIFQEILLPTLNQRGEEVDRVKIKGELPRQLQSRTHLWLRASDTRFYRVELLSPGTATLFGLTVLTVDPSFRVVSRLDAREAHWTAAGWELSDGTLREVGPQGRITSVPFQRTAVTLPETLGDFTEIQKPVSAMSFLELRDYVSHLAAAGFQVKKYLVDLYAKLSDPWKNLVMVLVAIPFSLQSPRGGRLFGSALAIGILVAYLVVDNLAKASAHADLLPPLLAAWTANIIFFGIGVSLFLRART